MYSMRDKVSHKCSIIRRHVYGVLPKGIQYISSEVNYLTNIMLHYVMCMEWILRGYDAW